MGVIGTASNKPVNWPRFSGELGDKPKINVNPNPVKIYNFQS